MQALGSRHRSAGGHRLRRAAFAGSARGGGGHRLCRAASVGAEEARRNEGGAGSSRAAAAPPMRRPSAELPEGDTAATRPCGRRPSSLAVAVPLPRDSRSGPAADVYPRKTAAGPPRPGLAAAVSPAYPLSLTPSFTRIARTFSDVLFPLPASLRVLPPFPPFLIVWLCSS